MDRLNALGKKIAETAQNTARGAKELADTVKLNSLISDEQRQINSLYTEIGKLFYETNMGVSKDTEFGKLCSEISDANERIGKYEQDIRTIKGLKCCPSCGSNVPLESAFCGDCGTKVETPVDSTAADSQLCPNCRAVIAEGASFCTACGTKIS